jgi:hypothetical protein
MNRFSNFAFGFNSWRYTQADEVAKKAAATATAAADAAVKAGLRQSHESTKFVRDGLPLSYGQFGQSASPDP